MNETQAMAVDLVLILHRGMNWDTWGTKRLAYWDILQEAVAESAYVPTLAAWLNSICGRMDIRAAGRNSADRARLEVILNSGQDAALLRVLRTETQFIILAARVAVESQKEARGA